MQRLQVAYKRNVEPSLSAESEASCRASGAGFFIRTPEGPLSKRRLKSHFGNDDKLVASPASW
jgi:hypothetical protein